MGEGVMTITPEMFDEVLPVILLGMAGVMAALLVMLFVDFFY